jgi:hypothetical protein
VQAAQAQQVASKARDKQRASSESERRFKDVVELRVAGVEAADALRKLPSNDSEQAEDEHRRAALRRQQQEHQERLAASQDDGGDDVPSQHIDITA